MLSLSQTPLTHSAHSLGTATRNDDTCTNATQPSYQSFAQASQLTNQPPSQGNQSVSQSIRQYPATSGIQSFAPHNTASPYLTHINSNDLSLSANHSFSLAGIHDVNSHCTFSHSHKNAHITQQHSTLQSLAHRLHSH